MKYSEICFFEDFKWKNTSLENNQIIFYYILIHLLQMKGKKDTSNIFLFWR